MSLSSKKIIEFINKTDNDFTASKVIDKFVTGNEVKKRKKSKSSKKKSSQQKDINTIYETLKNCTDIGLLIKNKKSYIINKQFSKIGTFISGGKNNTRVELPFVTVYIPSKYSNSAHNNDKVKVEITNFRRNFFYGKIVKVIERSNEKFLAIKIKNDRNRSILRLLDMPGNPNVITTEIIHTDNPVYISLTGNSFSSLPECEVLFNLSSDPAEADFQRVCIKHKLPKEYDLNLSEKYFLDRIPSEEIENRTDFTNLFTVTIDGETAKDYDDAVSYKFEDNMHILYVHIADVSAYVQKDSFLDREAFKRGNSYYLGHKVIPMLPEVLSNNLCSLVQDKLRLAVTAELFYDERGELLNYNFYRSNIKVNKRLTYVSSSNILEQKNDTPEYALLNNLKKLCSVLKSNRIERGRIDLSLKDSELIFKNGKFTDIKISERLTSHLIIEECMLSANEAVSLALRLNNIPTLYRIHEDMSSENVIALKKFLKSFGINVKISNNLGKSLQGILKNVKGKEFEHVANFIILKSMMQAYYDCEPVGHFGLGFKDYTHFTSPIRRYPDLIVHRTLKSLIDSKKGSYEIPQLTTIGEQTSNTERVAQKAERDLYKMKACRFMEDKIGNEYSGIISGVTQFGIYVTLNEIPIEGMIPLKFLTDDFYLVKEDDYTVIGRKYGKRFTLGDKIDVRVKRADILSLQIDFDYISKRR